MSKFFIVNLIDRLFVSICVFLTIFAWINFYTRDLWISFILGIIFSCACLFLLYYIISKKHEKKISTKKQIEKMDISYLAFRLLSNTEQLSFFAKLNKLTKFELKDGILTYEKNGKIYASICETSLSVFTENDFLNIVKATKNMKADIIEIICNKFENFNTKILKDKEFKLISKEKLFKDYFEKENIYPDASEIDTSIVKPKFVDLLANMFLPHKSKSYFVCGLVLIFSSIILPYHTYYVVFGSMLLLFAIICKLKKIISD